MNKKILQKCVDELKGATPNISYVLGMLETLIDLDEEAVQSASWVGGGNFVPIGNHSVGTANSSILTPAEQSVASAMDVLQSPIKPQR